MSWGSRIGVFKDVDLVNIAELLLDVFLTLCSSKKKKLFMKVMLI